MKFLVWWDSFNNEYPTAREIEAKDASEAACTYAEIDVNGNDAGIYWGRSGSEVRLELGEGHPLVTKDDNGVMRRFRVGVVDLKPVYGAVEEEEES